jgi:hypothetical protein
MEVPEISLLSTYNLQRILAERHSAVHRDEIVEDDDHGSAEDVDVKDEPSPNSVEEIAQIATECDLLSPVTRVHPAYKLLEPGNIRLLKIIQGRAGSDVYCHMGEFHIHAAPKYIALSYTWGSRYGDHQIFVNGFSLHGFCATQGMWAAIFQTGFGWTCCRSTNAISRKRASKSA